MTPYYEDEAVRLYNCDNRDLLPDLQIPNSLVLADPPYGQTSLEWDRWDATWIQLLPYQMKTMWVFGSLRIFMDNAHDFNGWKLSQDVIWEKHNGSSFHSDRFRRVHEQVCHFYRGAWGDVPHYTPTTPDATKRTVRRKQRPPHMGEIGEGPYASHDGGPRLMRSVIRERSTHGHASHPTEKPLGLLRSLIEYSTYAHSTVIVPFSGAGSELVAAKQLGRKAIGFEILEGFCEVAAKRLSQEVFNFAAEALTSNPEHDKSFLSTK